MPVDIKAVKQYLMTPAIYYSIYAESKEKYQSLFATATKTTTHITGMPGGNSDKEKVLANLVDSEDTYIEWFHRYMNARINVYNLILASDIPVFGKQLLLSRYVEMRPWKEILPAVTAERGISTRQVYRDRNKALQLLTDWVNSDAGIKYKKEIFL